MFEKKMLDNGYIKVIETYGSDERIVEAARMSTDKGFLGWGNDERAGDESLLKYLYEHKHSSPFEMAGIIIEVKAPIMVFREWMRHRTQSYNEMSARYIPLPNEDYVPSIDRLMINASKSNKQAGRADGSAILTEDYAHVWQRKLENEYAQIQKLYEEGLKGGIPKELARMPISVGRYSKMRANANLRNWLAFMTLRSAPNAQWEIRQYSNALGEIVEKHYPRTWELFLNGFNKENNLPTTRELELIDQIAQLKKLLASATTGN